MRRTRILTGAVLAAALAALLGVTTTAPAGTSGLPQIQRVTFTIIGTGTHQRVLPSSGNIAIAAGVPVQVTVVNYSSEYHTFTIPGLHVSALILPAHGQTPAKTRFTFTAQRSGTFKWHCTFCANGAHGRAHEMGGTVYAIIDPAALA
jgi:heme/copper-type cytochrome/quinol oxidase subunit 2